MEIWCLIYAIWIGVTFLILIHVQQRAVLYSLVKKKSSITEQLHHRNKKLNT
jgi:uncharacterized protein YhhL (DUF1145 family)